MEDLSITILNDELIDEYGSLNNSLSLDKESTYISLEIKNIPIILSKMMINKKLLTLTKNSDMKTITMIYFSSLKNYEELLKFFENCIIKIALNTNDDINLLKYIEEFYSISCELNLNNINQNKKKVKTKNKRH